MLQGARRISGFSRMGRLEPNRRKTSDSLDWCSGSAGNPEDWRLGMAATHFRPSFPPATPPNRHSSVLKGGRLDPASLTFLPRREIPPTFPPTASPLLQPPH